MPKFLAFDPSHRVYPIKGLLGCCHLVFDAEQRNAVLIDTGLVGEVRVLERVLGLGWSDIKALLLTHGHLDHTGNLARIKQLSGAPLFAHPLEQLHLEGRYPYTGPSRTCGRLEAIGRKLFSYRSVPIDEPLSPGRVLPYWGGLDVIYLPGHTAGHCGFYSARFDLLFSGDLFASYRFSCHLPPRFLNSCPEKLAASLRVVQELARASFSRTTTAASKARSTAESSISFATKNSQPVRPRFRVKLGSRAHTRCLT